MLLALSGGAIAGIVIGVVIGVLVLGVIIFFWGGYNSLVKHKNNVDEAYSTMDVYMKKRYDLIPNLVETVKGYAKHETETLENVMQARYSCMTASSAEEKAEKENMLSGTLKTLFSVAENYPNLKANENFVELQSSLQNLETEIASSRKYYNGCAKTYNIKVESFPTNLLAKMFKFEKRTLFEVAAEEERVAPKVQF